MILHEKISAQLPAWRERMKVLAKDHADVVVDHVTVGQIVGGMRDIKSLLTDVSFVDPAEGIRFRGMSIPEVLKKSKARGGKMPLVGGLFYLADGWRSPHQGRSVGSRNRMGQARGRSRLCLQDDQGHAERDASDDVVLPGGPGFAKQFRLRAEVSQHEEGCLLGSRVGR